MSTPILHLTTLFVILTVAGPCSSCKDNNKNEPETVCTPANTVLVPQDMKDRFFFKVGTYWIYRNLQTNETDSIWVRIFGNENEASDKYEDNGIKNKCYETFATVIVSELYKDKNRYTTYQTSIYPKKGGGDELFGLQESTPLNNYNTIYRLENRGGNYENQEGIEITMIDSILTNANMVYRDLLHLKYPSGQSTYDYLDDMYYAKNIGLVKFHRFTDTSDWELIRYKIIQ